MEEALEQIAEVGFEGFDCSEGDLQQWVGNESGFLAVMERLSLELAGVSSVLLPRKLRPGRHHWTRPGQPVTDPTQYRERFLEEVTEDGLREDFQAKKSLLDYLASVGAKVLVTEGPFMAAGSASERHYGLVGPHLDELGEEARLRGLKLAHHPRLGTLCQDEDGLDGLFDHTDSIVVGLCVDTGHLAAAGVNIPALVRRRADEVVHVHLKDLKEGRFTELGTGSVDFDSILTELKTRGYSGWAVAELDAPSGTAKESARLNREFLEKRSTLWR